MRKIPNIYSTNVLALCMFLGGLPAPAAAADPDARDRIAASLNAAFPDEEVTRVEASPIPDLYEVTMGAEMLYVTSDGRYVLRGDLLDLKDRRDLSEDKRRVAREDLLSKVPQGEVIEFAPEKPTGVVYVFTDITCGFCRRFHQNVGEMNRLGIAVRYLAFPRSGVGSATYRDMVSVWCAADRRQALTDAKLGKPVTPADCSNPVKKEFLLGEAMGVRGTPAVYLANGKSVGGYITPQDLLKAIQKN